MKHAYIIINLTGKLYFFNNWGDDNNITLYGEYGTIDMVLSQKIMNVMILIENL